MAALGEEQGPEPGTGMATHKLVKLLFQGIWHVLLASMITTCILYIHTHMHKRDKWKQKPFNPPASEQPKQAIFFQSDRVWPRPVVWNGGQSSIFPTVLSTPAAKNTTNLLWREILPIGSPSAYVHPSQTMFATHWSFHCCCYKLLSRRYLRNLMKQFTGTGNKERN